MKTIIWHDNATNSKQLYNLLSKFNDFEFTGYFSPESKAIDFFTTISTQHLQDVKLIVLPSMDQFHFREVIQYLYNNTIQYVDKIYMTTLKSLERKTHTYNTIDEILKINKIPYIPSMEYEVSKSCNLNCKRCNHFSNLQPQNRFANLDSFTEDIIVLKNYIDEIGTIYLLGGEPLLNKDLHKYIECFRQHFDTTKIIIITNGILIEKMSNELIESIRKNDASLGISFYPIEKKRTEKCIYLDRLGINYFCFNDINSFSSFINLNGDSNPYAQMHSCMLAFAHSFEDGKIYKCCMSENISVFNTAFNTSLPEPYFCLKGQNISAKKLRTFLLSPNSLCRFCRKETKYTWEITQGKTVMSDWCE